MLYDVLCDCGYMFLHHIRNKRKIKKRKRKIKSRKLDKIKIKYKSLNIL